MLLCHRNIIAHACPILLLLLMVLAPVKAAPRKFVGANWKCSLETAPEVDALVDRVNQNYNSLTKTEKNNLELCLLVPYVFIDRVRQRLHRQIHVGSQNVWEAAPVIATYSSRYKTTGTITANMLQSVGCTWVLLGHSDRRNQLYEQDRWIAEKVPLVLASGMGVVLTLGELPAQRRWGRTVATLRRQLRWATRQIPPDAWHRVVVAYEPVWAVGPGAQPCAPAEAERILALLRSYIRRWFGPAAAQHCRFTYTGSVDADNCRLYADVVDGFVVGRAGLNATQLHTILQSWTR